VAVLSESEGSGAAEHNSDTKKEAVSRTYQGVDGYTLMPTGKVSDSTTTDSGNF
jgi:hypothetical protein